MDIKDLFIGPLFLFIIFIVAYGVRNKVTDLNTRKYFIPALSLKIFGAISLGLIYQFYYKGGDTFSYYTHGSRHIWNAFFENPLAGLWMIFGKNCNYNHDYAKYIGEILFFCDDSSYFIVRISALFGLFCFHTYSAIAMMFALVSFIGVWSMFITFNKMFPDLRKEMMLSCFMMPSVVFWGSGLLKDSITFGFLGLFFTYFYCIFIEKRYSKSAIFILILSFWVIKSIKIYIILCFVPAAVIWVFIVYNQKIRSQVTRILLRPIMIGIALLFGFLAANYIPKEDDRYSINNLSHTAQNTYNWLSYVSKAEKGSGYNLGDIEFTPTGMLKKFPAAVNVTLFRPYIWESKNIVMLLSAFESLFFLYLTLTTIWKVKFKRILFILTQYPVVSASLAFSITFAFAIGISTANFGTLVRYKIPLMPFYLIAILVIRNYGAKKYL